MRHPQAAETLLSVVFLHHTEDTSSSLRTSAKCTPRSEDRVDYPRNQGSEADATERSATSQTATAVLIDRLEFYTLLVLFS